MGRDDDSPEERRRVELKIKNLILKFYHARRSNPVFFCDELRVFIARNGVIVAPASPDRILRMLRQQGHLDYKVTDRTHSEYTFFYQEDEHGGHGKNYPVGGGQGGTELDRGVHLR